MKAKTHSNFGFHLMSLVFHFRDLLRPPVKILWDAGVCPGMTVLDFGCGPGGFSLASARLIGSTGYVLSLDIHPLALHTLQRAAAKSGLSNIKTIHADDITKIHPACVDMVLLYDVLHELDKIRPVMQNIYRILKPEGILSVSDHHLEKSVLLAMVTDGGLFELAHHNRRIHQFTKVKTNRVAI